MDQVEKNTAYIKKYVLLLRLKLQTKVTLKVALTVACKQQRLDRPYRASLRLLTTLDCNDSCAEQDAEMASLNNTPDAFKLYDVAVKCV